MAEVYQHADGPAHIRLSLQLYIAGDAPNSLRARANLRHLTAPLDQDAVTIEIVDVLEEPLRALEDGVLVTPTLVRVQPSPTLRIIGDLSNPGDVIAALGLEDILP